MDSAKFAECESEPLTACSVTVLLPVAVVTAAPKITATFAPAALVNGLAGLEVIPAGRSVSVICTESTKPCSAFTATVMGGLTPPCAMESEAEERVREKSAGTTRAGTTFDWVTPPWQPANRVRASKVFASANALWGSALAECRGRGGAAGNRFSGFCTRRDCADGDTAEPPCRAGGAGRTRYRAE